MIDKKNDRARQEVKKRSEHNNGNLSTNLPENYQPKPYLLVQLVQEGDRDSNTN